MPNPYTWPKLKATTIRNYYSLRKERQRKIKVTPLYLFSEAGPFALRILGRTIGWSALLDFIVREATVM